MGNEYVEKLMPWIEAWKKGKLKEGKYKGHPVIPMFGEVDLGEGVDPIKLDITVVLESDIEDDKTGDKLRYLLLSLLERVPPRATTLINKYLPYSEIVTGKRTKQTVYFVFQKYAAQDKEDAGKVVFLDDGILKAVYKTDEEHYRFLIVESIDNPKVNNYHGIMYKTWWGEKVVIFPLDDLSWTAYSMEDIQEERMSQQIEEREKEQAPSYII